MNYISSGQHCGHSSAGSVVRVDMDRHVRMSFADALDEHSGCSRLQQPGHILNAKAMPNKTDILDGRTAKERRTYELTHECRP